MSRFLGVLPQKEQNSGVKRSLCSLDLSLLECLPKKSKFQESEYICALLICLVSWGILPKKSNADSKIHFSESDADSETLLDAEVDEGECTDEGEEVKGAEVEGRKADDEKLQEVEMEEEAEENEAEEEEEEEEEEDPTPDQFDLAKIFAGPNEFKDVSLLQHLE